MPYNFERVLHGVEMNDITLFTTSQYFVPPTLPMFGIFERAT